MASRRLFIAYILPTTTHLQVFSDSLNVETSRASTVVFGIQNSALAITHAKSAIYS